MTRIVELIRVSTDTQRDRGTHEVQRADLDKLRQSRPGTLVERIEALGVSGAKGVADRADLQRLFELSKLRRYDELRVWNVDRLTRADDPRERFAIYGAARDAGALIVDCTGRVIDPNDESGMGELDYYLQTMFAARERKKIAARTKAGRHLKAAQGKLSQGVPPYARKLDRQTMTWVLVPEEAKTYRRIIDAVLAGQSIKTIADGLNADGIPSPKGGSWPLSTIKRLLHRPTIVGEYRTCGTVTQIPAIATAEEWARIKATLRTHVSRPEGTKPREALLRGLLVCASCGMRVHVETDGVGTVARYGCPKPSRRSSRCPDRHTVQVPRADAHVREALLGIVRNPKRLDAAIRAARGQVKNPERALRDAEAELAKLAQKEQRTLRLYNEGLLSDELVKAELQAIKSARQLAQERQQTASARPPAAELEMSREALARAVEGASPARIRELVAILVPEGGLKLTAAGLQIDGVFPVGAPRDAATLRSCAARPAPGRR